jgi:hypothetical protein
VAQFRNAWDSVATVVGTPTVTEDAVSGQRQPGE